jgi:hypothetical protein
VRKDFPDRRKHSSILRWIIDMHSAEKGVSWTRWMGTIIISNVMLVWTLSCIFDQGWRIKFTLEDMPTGLVAIVSAALIGKVGQSAVERLGDGVRRWRV